MSGGVLIDANVAELLQAVALLLAMFLALALVGLALLAGWVEVRKAVSNRARTMRTPHVSPSSKFSSSDGARDASRPHGTGDRP